MSREPTDEQLAGLLDNFASEHLGGLSQQRLAVRLREIWRYLAEVSPIGNSLKEAIELGGELRLKPEDEWLGINLVLAGNVVRLGRFKRDELLARPQG